MSYTSGSVCPQALETCFDTSRLVGKDIPMLNFLLWNLVDGGREGLERRWTLRGSSSAWKVPASEDVSQPSTVLIVVGGIKIGDGSDRSSDWGLSLLSHCPAVGCNNAIVAEMLNELCGRFGRLDRALLRVPAFHDCMAFLARLSPIQ